MATKAPARPAPKSSKPAPKPAPVQRQQQQRQPERSAPESEQRKEQAVATRAQEPTRTQVPTRTVPRQVPATQSDMDPALLARMKADQGGGLSKDQSDNLVPLIYLLQPLSPQCVRGDPARIEGAEAGDIWLRNAEDPIIKGGDGMLFQPCAFWKDVVEWIPDRGGFVGRHDISCMPRPAENKGWTGTLSDVQEITDDDDPNGWPRYIRSSNNNEVVETRYFAGNVYFDDGRQPLSFVIPLSSTGHSFGKQWMFLQNSQTLPDGSPNDKSWVYLYRLTTVLKQNTKGSWYMYSVQKERPVANLDEYERGLNLNAAFATGEKKIDDEQMQRGDNSSTSDGADLNNDEDM